MLHWLMKHLSSGMMLLSLSLSQHLRNPDMRPKSPKLVCAGKVLWRTPCNIWKVSPECSLQKLPCSCFATEDSLTNKTNTNHCILSIQIKAVMTWNISFQKSWLDPLTCRWCRWPAQRCVGRTSAGAPSTVWWMAWEAPPALALSVCTGTAEWSHG